MSDSKTNKSKVKSCFIIMPISDMEGYDNGHFTRVYDHLIKPACEKAGFKPIRADDVASSNYIVIDILSRIVDSDLVLCDLSGRNPNVLYELGIRQAFNFPTVLIKDIKTDKIFDIQGLRYTEYNQTLRIDSVEQQISEIEKSINETVNAKGKDVNSLIQLLGMKSASPPSQVELSNETSVILSAIKDLASRVSSLEKPVDLTNPYTALRTKSSITPIVQLDGGEFLINGNKITIGDTLYIRGKKFGQLADVMSDAIVIKKRNGETSVISIFDKEFPIVNDIPF